MDDKLKDVVITMARAVAANTLIPDKLRLDLEAALRQLEPQKPESQTKEYLSDGEIATLISGGLVDSKVVFALAKEVQEWRNAFDELANRGGGVNTLVSTLRAHRYWATPNFIEDCAGIRYRWKGKS